MLCWLCGVYHAPWWGEQHTYSANGSFTFSNRDGSHSKGAVAAPDSQHPLMRNHSQYEIGGFVAFTLVYADARDENGDPVKERVHVRCSTHVSSTGCSNTAARVASCARCPPRRAPRGGTRRAAGPCRSEPRQTSIFRLEYLSSSRAGEVSPTEPIERSRVRVHGLSALMGAILSRMKATALTEEQAAGDAPPELRALLAEQYGPGIILYLGVVGDRRR